jgi:hypothetical protein
MFELSTVQPILRELDAALALEGAVPVEWIICGGTALAIRGLARRTTRDVDVIAAWSPQSLEIVPLERFARPVERAIDRVAAAHPELQSGGLRWVNLGASGLLRFGLPPGCLERLARWPIGECLTLQVPDRLDLIAMKLLAASDPSHRRQAVHRSDLRAIAPEEEELRFAIDWVLGVPDPNHQTRAELREFLEELGRADLAYYIS